jgi:hypothetical protein
VIDTLQVCNRVEDAPVIVGTAIVAILPVQLAAAAAGTG